MDKTYTYKNEGAFMSISSGDGIGLVHTYWESKSSVGRIVSATGLKGNAGYIFNHSLYGAGPDYVNVGGGLRVELDGARPAGNLYRVVSEKEGEFTFENSARNLIKSHKPVSGSTSTYHYSNSGQLLKISSGLGDVTLKYPSNLSALGCINERVCDKPTEVTDRRGNTTNYTYNSRGQTVSITHPASSNGVRPTTLYEYSELYAYYKKDSTQIARADSPISLLTKESSCRTSAMVSGQCQAGTNDKVEINYYYGPQTSGVANNLLLRGKSITALGSSALETRVTCFAYDKYGNKIGETLPKANISLTSCP